MEVHSSRLLPFHEPDEGDVPTKKVIYEVPEELAEEIENVVLALRLTPSSLMEHALRNELRRLCSEHNGGRPFERHESPKSPEVRTFKLPVERRVPPVREGKERRCRRCGGTFQRSYGRLCEDCRPDGPEPGVSQAGSPGLGKK
mgnify:CR=1 FL=1